MSPARRALLAGLGALALVAAPLQARAGDCHPIEIAGLDVNELLGPRDAYARGWLQLLSLCGTRAEPVHDR